MERSDYLALFYSFILLTGYPCYAYLQTTIPNDYMICRSVPDIFGSVIDFAGDSMPELEGPKGPRGPMGKTGLPGPRGELDYSKVNEILEEKIVSLQARLAKAENELKEIKSTSAPPTTTGTVTQPTRSPQDIQYEQECLTKYHSPIHVGSMCYKVIGGGGINWQFKAAESNCTALGGYLADLNSRTVYDRIYDYVDRTYNTVVQAWTGMRYKNDAVYLTNGKKADFVKWMAYNPRKSRSSYSSYYSNYKFVIAYIDTSSRTNGLQNSPETRNKNFAICHFDVSKDTTTRSPTSPWTSTEQDSDYYYDY